MMLRGLPVRVPGANQEDREAMVLGVRHPIPCGGDIGGVVPLFSSHHVRTRFVRRTYGVRLSPG